MVIHEPHVAKARSSSFTERVAAISARRSHWPPSCAAQAGCSPVAAINGDECGVDVCSVSSCPSQCNSSEDTGAQVRGGMSVPLCVGCVARIADTPVSVCACVYSICAQCGSARKLGHMWCVRPPKYGRSHTTPQGVCSPAGLRHACVSLPLCQRRPPEQVLLLPASGRFLFHRRSASPVQRAASMSILRTPTTWDLTDPHHALPWQVHYRVFCVHSSVDGDY